jgi:hypothetical protein
MFAAVVALVGLAPNRANARRQAAIEGSSAIGVASSRSVAACWAAR